MAAPAWMLDTNILSDLIKNPGSPMARRIAALPSDAVCTSIVVACELRFGAQRKGSAVLHSRVNELLTHVPVLELDVEADRHYAAIRFALETAGTPIGGNDLLIAAHARSQALVLVTHNLREFRRVPHLQIEDWLTPPPLIGP